MLDKALTAAKIGFWVALILLVLQGTVVLQHTSEALRDNADNFDKHLVNLELIAAGTSGRTVGILDKRLDEANAILDANSKLAIFGFNSRLADTNKIAAQGVVLLSDHLVNAEVILSNQLDKSNASLKTVADNTTKISKDVTRVALPLASLAEQISTAAPEFLNCDPSPVHPVGNSKCLPVVYAGIAGDFHQIGFDVKNYVHHFTNPPPQTLGQKLYNNSFGLLIPAAKIYGAVR